VPIPDNSPASRDETIFAAALDLLPDQRPAYLDQQCGGDTAQRRRVETLLNAIREAGDLLETPPTGMPDGPFSAAGNSASAPATERAGDRIGRYKLLQQIGVGGCGVVYMAEQEEPIRRRVALKVIKLGMDTRQVVARFEAERQALALMEHPNIAKVFDASATATGRPCFVMELVRGTRITTFCDEQQLSTDERLELFTQVCSAVQHAHQKGIIHRDLKPSNVLVTTMDGKPVPKVIDFGIAKATGDQRLTDKTLFTAFEQFIGTPAYMSPEQAEMSGVDVDTRSDIYSLGVLLYELLTGTTPFENDQLLRSGLDGLRKILREEEPLKPSKRLTTLTADRLTTVASQRRTEVPRLLHTLRGDLDWIVMKALEKDRARRYESASALAEDVQRYVNHEAVQARPPSTAYLFQKLVHRHKLVFAAGTAVVAALLLGLGFSMASFVRERQARSEAEVRQNEAETARVNESAQRKLADQQRVLAEENARKALENERYSARLLYAADINLAQQALNANNLGRARRLLDYHRPGSGPVQIENGQPVLGTNANPTLSTSGTVDFRGWEWRYLWQQCQSDALAVLNSKASGVFSVSFSRDGSLLAVGYFNGRTELWDVKARKLIRVPQERIGQYANLVFSPTSDDLVVNTPNEFVSLYDLPTGTVRTLCNTAAFVRDLSFTEDGKRLTVLSAMGRERVQPVFVIDMQQGVIVSSNRVEVSDRKFCANARLSPDYQRLYLGRREGNRNLLQCVRMPDWRVLWEVEGEVDTGFTAMALSPDGRWLVTAVGYAGNTIRVWDAMTGRQEARLDAHSAYVTDLVFSRDGKRLASGSSDQTIRLWDPATWKPVGIFRGHDSELHALAFSPDGNFLASGSKDGMVILWDASAQTSPHGSRILPADSTFVFPMPRTPALMRVSTGQKSTLFDLAARTETGLQQYLDSSDSAKESMALYQARMKERAKMTLSGTRESQIFIGNSLLIFSPGGDMKLHNTLKPEMAPARLSQGGIPSQLAVSPDNRTFAVSSQSGIIGLYDAEKQERLQVLHGHLKSARGLAFTRDGRRLASGSGGNEAVKLWDVVTGRELLTLAGNSDLLDVVEFSDDGNTLVVGAPARPGSWEYWRVPSWQEIEDSERTRGRWPATGDKH
jgi:WD40 repeat protein/serine/threonine protein kinase